MKGVASIKAEYLFRGDQTIVDEPANKIKKVDEPVISDIADTAPKSKKARGQNKKRYYSNKFYVKREETLCRTLHDLRPIVEQPNCENPRCRDLHDIKQYLSDKPPDIGKKCYLFDINGHCPRGLTCRFGSSHITEEGRNIVSDGFNDCKKENGPEKDIQFRLRKKLFDFSLSNKINTEVSQLFSKKSTEKSNEPTTEATSNCSVDNESSKPDEPIGPHTDGTIVEVREKKAIDWKNKLYLAPLTTLGNLPFRRICKEWGADVTCGEMAMATSILQGSMPEWALLRRHPSEDLFGVQLCGNFHGILTRCVQLIEETTNVDFIDLNLGCPIELIYKKGGGSGMLLRQNELKKTVECLTRISNVPITVKTRSGVYDNKPIAHQQIPIYNAAGVSLITVHGRSREQRYTRFSDWEYINQCAKAATPTPVFGNGDILSYQDYKHFRSTYPDIAGVMIGRGALYKPWIFTEIKEDRDWDISASERLDILKKFVNYGLEHWGSDTRGVETTRRFLLEWLSFLYRYIPYGLLEHPPQRINERPPRYIGRNDLETLMASPNCDDWIKISEMLCGPVPEGFKFLPKHKANAWSSE